MVWLSKICALHELIANITCILSTKPKIKKRVSSPGYNPEATTSGSTYNYTGLRFMNNSFDVYVKIYNISIIG